MSQKRNKVQHLVNIYVSGDMLYVIAMTQQPNVTWLSIAPAYKASINNPDELIQAIKKAKSQSQAFTTNTSHDEETIAWDGEDGRVWDTATQLWSIRWYDDENVLMVRQERISPSDDPEFASGSGWRRIRGAEKKLAAPVSNETIAHEFLTSVRTSA